jgi:hypothetical protein
MQVAMLGTLLITAWNGVALTLQSEHPLPPGLETAVARELASSALGADSQSTLVVRIHGNCRVDRMPRRANSDGPLGWVDIVDGEMLSIIHLDCTRIGEALARLVDNPNSVQTEELYARAMARVIRHELRHVQLNTTRHEKRGENKAALLAEELVAPSGRIGQ